jgi:hypothetical protein
VIALASRLSSQFALLVDAGVIPRDVAALALDLAADDPPRLFRVACFAVGKAETWTDLGAVVDALRAVRLDLYGQLPAGERALAAVEARAAATPGGLGDVLAQDLGAAVLRGAAS